MAPQPVRERIWQVLETATYPLTSREISQRAACGRGSVQKLLRCLRLCGEVEVSTIWLGCNSYSRAYILCSRKQTRDKVPACSGDAQRSGAGGPL